MQKRTTVLLGTYARARRGSVHHEGVMAKQRSWSKGVVVALALALALGPSACSGQDGVPGGSSPSGGAGGAGAAGGGAAAGAGGGGADTMLDDASQAIRNQYFGCDPGFAQACGPDGHPDPSYDPAAEALMLDRLGRPTTTDVEAHWCLNAEAAAPASDAACRHFAKDTQGHDWPEVIESAPPSHGAGARAFYAAFERGALVAHLRDATWSVHEVYDETSTDPETTEPAPAATLYLRTLDPPGTASFLGVPDSSPAAGEPLLSQIFVNGPCTYSVAFDAAAPRFTTTLEAGGSDCAVPAGLAQIDALSLLVNGNRLRAAEERAVRFVAERVVPRLGGTRADKLRVAGRVAWWTLKEGVLMLQQPLPYSNCHDDVGGVDHTIGPLEVCTSTIAWQVGIAAVQVVGRNPATVAAAIDGFFPGASIAAVLEGTAWDAFPSDSATRDGIGTSTGDLQLSWLLRNAVIGTSFEEPPVTSECILQTKNWCFGCGWSTSCRYAPSQSAAFGAMEDLCRALNRLAPLSAGELRTDYAGGCSAG